jgi:hypothetical protein
MDDVFQPSWCKSCRAAVWSGYYRGKILIELDAKSLNYFEEAKAIDEGLTTYLCQPESNGQFWVSARDAYGVNWWHKKVVNNTAGSFVVLAAHSCHSLRALASHEYFFGKRQKPTGDGGDDGRIPF